MSAPQRLAFQTLACRRLGIELPIVQAPIGSATTPALAAAVSEAGGLGTLALSWTHLAGTQEAVRATSRLTSRTFAVNLVLEWPQHDRLAVCLREGVRVISTFWGDPAPYVAAIHAAGALHVHAVGSVTEAVAAVGAGVDIVVAQGWEAGGHVRGQVSTFALVPAVVDAVHPVPVLAAGGIADGRGLAAALLLGAQGAWIGTRFLLADEADVHDEYRARLLNAVAADTLLCRTFDGGWPDAPHRVLRNSTTDAWAAAGRPASPHRPGENDVVAHAAGRALHRYGDDIPTRATSGDAEALAHYAGQGVGLARATAPAGVLAREIAREARSLLDMAGRPPTLVVAAPSSSRTGDLLTELAGRRGVTVRRLEGLDEHRAEAVRDAGAIVVVPGRGDAERQAHGPIRALTEAARRVAPSAHVLLVSSFAVGHGAAHPLNRVNGNQPGLPAAEQTLRVSGLAWTIVRPTWLTDDPPGAHAVRATQDPSPDGMLSRADLAAAVLAAIEEPLARGKTFALFNEPGEPPADWAPVFASLTPDPPSPA